MKRMALLVLLLLATAPAVAQNIAAQPQWLKVYTYEPYDAYWHVKLSVDDVASAVSKATKALEKAKGESALSNAAFNPKYHQLSYRTPQKTAEKALKEIRKLGLVESLRQAPSDRPQAAAEVADKLASLQADLKSGKELSTMPAVSGLANELAAHLAQLDQLYRTQEGRVLINIELQEKPKN